MLLTTVARPLFENQAMFAIGKARRDSAGHAKRASFCEIGFQLPDVIRLDRVAAGEVFQRGSGPRFGQ